jgi:hypothetical protein
MLIRGPQHRTCSSRTRKSEFTSQHFTEDPFGGYERGAAHPSWNMPSQIRLIPHLGSDQIHRLWHKSLRVEAAIRQGLSPLLRGPSQDGEATGSTSIQLVPSPPAFTDGANQMIGIWELFESLAAICVVIAAFLWFLELITSCKSKSVTAEDLTVEQATSDQFPDPCITVWDLQPSEDGHQYLRFATLDGCAPPVHAEGCGHPECIARRLQISDQAATPFGSNGDVSRPGGAQ